MFNKGLSMMGKVPKNALLFVSISQFNNEQDTLMIGNKRGQVVYFSNFAKVSKKTCLLTGLRKKLKGRPYLIIKDTTRTDTMNAGTMRKLSQMANFLYIKPNADPEKTAALLSNPKTTQFAERHPQTFMCGFDPAQQIYFSFYYSKGVSLDILNQHRYIHYDHFQILEQTHSKILQEYVAGKFSMKLKLFDILIINFVVVCHQTKDFLIGLVNKVSKKLKQIEQISVKPTDHFPVRSYAIRRCKKCEILEYDKNKKSKFLCLGCCKAYGVEFALCVSCWGDFHELVLPKVAHVQPPNMKKQYQRYKARKQIQNKLTMPFDPSSTRNRYLQQVDVMLAVEKLDQNLTSLEIDIQNMFQDPAQQKLLKRTVQYLLLSTLETFNTIIDDASGNNQIKEMVEEEEVPSSSNSSWNEEQ